MNKEIKFDHFENIDELIQQIDEWYNNDEPFYERWFGLSDLFKLGLYIRDLENQIKYRNQIIKEAREYIYSFEFGKLFESLNNEIYCRKQLQQILDKENK